MYFFFFSGDKRIKNSSAGKAREFRTEFLKNISTRFCKVYTSYTKKKDIDRMNRGIEEREREREVEKWMKQLICLLVDPRNDSSKINLLIWMYVSKCNGLMYNISCSTIISLRTAELPIQERSREEFNNRSNATSITFKLEILYFCT